MKALLNSAALGALLALAACGHDRMESGNLTASAAPSSTTSLASRPDAGTAESMAALDDAEPAAGPTGLEDSVDEMAPAAGQAAAGDTSGSTQGAQGQGLDMAGSADTTTAEGTQVAALELASDEEFANFAASGNAAEIQMSQLAMTQASNPDVRAYAQRMIREHSDAGAKLKAIAASKGMSLPSAPAGNAQVVLQELRSLQGEAFDRAFVDAQVRAHKQMLALMQSEVQSGEDLQLKAFAGETSAAVQSHLEMAQQLATEVGS